GRSLEAASQLKSILQEDEDSPAVEWLAAEIGDNHEVVSLVNSAINDDPPLSVGDGRVIREGFSPELDALRESSRNAQGYVAGLERRERERTGIKSLKVGYNKVFGYYIEVSKTNVSLVPDEYIRRQTLVGGERYITPEMKEYESQVLSARDRIYEMESSLFRQVCGQVGGFASQVMAVAKALAHGNAERLWRLPPARWPSSKK
ncbi:MAG TPA: DNA mismatch repair protein MutS, partial [Nitrospinae bacterium]|nr:DNA mismatch repair protein MutS [Nitrospinota bacterium]